MNGADDLSLIGYAIATFAHAAFALKLGRQGYFRRSGSTEQRLFAGAVAATAAWALLSFVDPFTRRVTAAYAAAGADLLRYALWFAFLVALLRPRMADARGPARGAARALTGVAALAIGLGIVALGRRVAGGIYDLTGERWLLAPALALALVGLVLVEQLYRNLNEDSRWNAKPVCLGLGIVLFFDLYVASEAVLFGQLDRDALAVRGMVHALAVPLLYLASRRRGDWLRGMQVSRTAAFYSATLLLSGAYLLLVSAAGYYVRDFGGHWGRALQLTLLAVGLALLGVLLFSGSWRAWLRVFVGKHFFSYRYDYREEWLRFTATLSSEAAPHEVGGLVVRGLANMVECPAGALWTASLHGPELRQTARWNVPAVDTPEPPDSPLCGFLRERAWVVDLDEYRRVPQRYGGLALPARWSDDPNLWLIVPLLVGDELLGFVTLARPRAPVEPNWEVRDLLKTASRQAAGFLAQMRATEALLEARKFDAFNRMSAFVVHDLKNIVTQLSLMMRNAERHHDNPEFRRDMLLTVESSLEKMRRLMLQLREGAAPPGAAHGVELLPILHRLAAAAARRGRTVDVDAPEGLATRGQEDRLERVLGHLVDNAIDATPATGRVWIAALRASGQVALEVGDTGVGMSEAFVQERLFRPFSSTKSSGMGIGSYESFQYIRELGGTVAVETAPGRGTRIRLRLPLFEARSESDLATALPH